MRSAVLCLCQLCFLSFAWAQDGECIVGEVADDRDRTCLSAAELVGRLDLTVPSNALFALMGSSPETVIRPTPGEKLSISFLPELVDAFGDEESAFAVEIRPALYMVPERFAYGELHGQAQQLSGSDGRVAQLTRAKRWAPLTGHFALTRADGDQPERLGVGVNYVKDSADPMFSTAYGDCLFRDVFPHDERAFQRASELAAQDESLDEQTALEMAYAEILRDLRELEESCVRTSSPWNRRILGAGVAFYHADLPEDAVVRASGLGAWFSHAFPLGVRGQLITHARYTDDLLAERTVNEQQVFEAVDSVSLGARYTHSVAGDGVADPLASDVIRAFFEVGYFEEDIVDVTDDYVQFAFGAEFRLRTNLYFQVLFGDTHGSDQQRDVFFDGQVKWSFSSAAR